VNVFAIAYPEVERQRFDPVVERRVCGQPQRSTATSNHER
jgi:hypothetical protein